LTIARGLLQVAVLFTFAYGLVSLLEAGKRHVKLWWATRRAYDITGKPFPDIRTYRGPTGPAPGNTLNPTPTDQRDLGDEDDAATDIATEGVGTEARPVPAWQWASRPDGRLYVWRAWPSWTTPLAYLPEPEWRTWSEIISQRGVLDG
jgi:hypothetical protein